jgi:predicted enzyme related to lactoylglutathione lyase
MTIIAIKFVIDYSPPKSIIMNETANAINWFEIAVTDMDRAKKFYEAVFSIKLQDMEMPGMKMKMFPAGAMDGKVGGCLIQDSSRKPSADGVRLYLNGNPDLSIALGKVEAAGGKVHWQKTLINEQTGYMAFFEDAEGNLLGMHSNK